MLSNFQLELIPKLGQHNVQRPAGMRYVRDFVPVQVHMPTTRQNTPVDLVCIVPGMEQNSAPASDILDVVVVPKVLIGEYPPVLTRDVIVNQSFAWGKFRDFFHPNALGKTDHGLK